MLNKRNWWNVAAVATLALVALFAVAPASAQEQVGAIIGTVSDASGAVLPGATVEAVSAGGTRLSGTTNESGAFRFPRVPPGTYVVVAKLDGFNPAEVQGVVVNLGSTITANVTLEVGAVSETISVVGEAGQIDIKGSATAASISGEQIELMPKGRDFTSVVGQAAGASNEAFLGGISIDGASGSENRFVIDGIDTTNPQDGVSGQNFITDFLEEVQVKSAGYAAEYGGSVGGVINAVTKSGTNEFKGWVGAYYSDSDVGGGDSRPTYREELPAQNYHKTFTKDDVTRAEPGFALGGPIAQDKAWFYVGYNPSFQTTTRHPEGTSATYDSDRTDQYFAGNIKGNVGSQFLYKVSANLSPSTVDGNLPNVDGSTSPLADLSVKNKFPTSSYSAYSDYIPSDMFYLSGRLGYFTYDTETSGISAVARFQNSVGAPPLPQSDPRYTPPGYVSIPAASFTGTDTDKWTREAASLDGNVFFTGAGTHAMKAGVQYEKLDNTVSTGEVGNLYRFYWGTAFQGVRGTYGAVAVRDFRTEGSAQSKNLGLYLQDSWSVLPNLTLNLGIRTEKEEVPNYGAARDASLPKNAISFGFNDKLAPRLGFSWDVMSDQKLKVYGSYGTYYDITKLEMPRGSFGADQWIAHAYPLNTLDWASIASQCVRVNNDIAQNPCPSLGQHVPRDLRAPTDPATAIDPNLKPMEQTEYQIGADYALSNTSVLGFRYVNKSLDTTIEDIGYLVILPDGTQEEQYITGNPGEGLVAGDPAGPIPPQAKAVRDYEAFEFTYDRRFADNWSLRASYTYSKLEGNYSGLASSDEFGRTDPNVARYFDGLAYGYDSQGRFVSGKLNTDRPNAIEVQALYRAPWGTNFGVNTSWRNGSPVSTQASFNGVQFFPYGRGDKGDTPDLTQTDLLISHPFKIGNYSLEVSMNVINLFDENTVTRIGNNSWKDDICDIVAGCDYSNAWYFEQLVPYDYNTVMAASGATPDPAYGQALAYQAPRVIRFGLKFLF